MDPVSPVVDPTEGIPTSPLGEGEEIADEAVFEEKMVDVLGFMIFYDMTVDLMQDNE